MRSKVLVAGAVMLSVFAFPSAAYAAATFAPPVNHPAGGTLDSLAVADLNGDTKPDVVVTDTSGQVAKVLLGAGDGALAAPTSHPTGAFAVSTAIADLNGDTKPDIVTANLSSQDVSVLLGSGGGTFAPHMTYPAGADASSVAIGDLNGDRRPDLAVGSTSSDNVSVLFGDGSGVFSAPAFNTAGDAPRSVAIADLNGDSKSDIVAANANSNDVSVLFGNANGTFATAINHPVGLKPSSVAVADLNDDNKPDIVTANRVDDTVSVLLGNGADFAAAAHHATGDGPTSVATADVNGDQSPDIVTANTSGTVSVLPNIAGDFGTAVNHVISGGMTSASMIAVDLNADTKPDVVVAENDSVKVLLNTSTFPFTTGPTASISGTVRQGQTLTAKAGSPVPTPDALTYRWFANGTAISGATAKTFKLTSGQVGKRISVRVTATKAGFANSSDTSPQTVPVVGIFSPGPSASLAGFNRIGSTLTARPGSPSPAPTSYAYRWYADGRQIANWSPTLKLTSAHYSKRIQVRVYAVRSGYLTAASLSAPTGRVNNLQAKTISMELNDYTLKRGQRVRAEIERLARYEPWSIWLDGKKLAAGTANSKGIAVTYLTIPTNATVGARTIRANGYFPDRTDPDTIKIR